MTAPKAIRRTSAVIVVLIACLASPAACSGRPDRATPSPRQPERDPAAKVVDLPSARGIDVRHPSRAAPIPSTVVPIDVPDRAPGGRQVEMTFRTRPDSSCQLQIAYERSGTPVRLPPAVADALGFVSWTWRAESVRGDAKVDVLCSGGQQMTTTIAIA